MLSDYLLTPDAEATKKAVYEQRLAEAIRAHCEQLSHKISQTTSILSDLVGIISSLDAADAQMSIQFVRDQVNAVETVDSLKTLIQDFITAETLKK